MKKTLKILFTLLLAFVCLIACVSCQKKPELDIDDAEENLKEAGYYISKSTWSDFSEMVDNCTSVGAEEYLQAFDNDDNAIFIIKYDSAKTAKYAYEIFKLQKDQRAEEVSLEIEAGEYVLKKYSDKLSTSEIERIRENMRDIQEDFDEEIGKLEIGISGKTVWIGHAIAIKASRGD